MNWSSWTTPTAVAASAVISTPAEITSAQEHLRYLGYEPGSVSGTMDAGTLNAIKTFQGAIGAPQTGLLTVEQLQALFVRAAEKQGKRP